MKRAVYLMGFILLIFGIYLSVVKQEPHFYSFFSLGMVLILFQSYNELKGKNL